MNGPACKIGKKKFLKKSGRVPQFKRGPLARNRSRQWCTAPSAWTEAPFQEPLSGLTTHPVNINARQNGISQEAVTHGCPGGETQVSTC
jgi:hypothetical protein